MKYTASPLVLTMLAHAQDFTLTLLQLGVRFYDPKVGRFTQRDRLASSITSYIYCKDNPLSWYDSSGQEPFAPGCPFPGGWTPSGFQWPGGGGVNYPPGFSPPSDPPCRTTSGWQKCRQKRWENNEWTGPTVYRNEYGERTCWSMAPCLGSSR